MGGFQKSVENSPQILKTTKNGFDFNKQRKSLGDIPEIPDYADYSLTLRQQGNPI